MPDYFDAMNAAHQDAAQGLAQAHAGLGLAIDGLLRATRLERAARTEHEDLRVTVTRLEVLVLELSTQVRALRTDRDERGPA